MAENKLANRDAIPSKRTSVISFTVTTEWARTRSFYRLHGIDHGVGSKVCAKPVQNSAIADASSPLDDLVR
jgi:hypothetical protein